MTMNEMDGDTKHAYDRYMLETLQLEHERAEALRDASQAHHHVCGHTNAHATQVAADGSITHDVGDVKPSVPDDAKRIDTKGWDVGRGPVTYKTGVVASNGVEEVTSTMLCHRCDREAEYAGYCEQHWDEEQERQALRESEEYDEWLDDLWNAEELERAAREAEEGRSDH